MWVPYKLRCASSHGENSLPTFCYRQDDELQVIRVVNRLLDAFLTAELVKWLEKDEVTQTECAEKIRIAVENDAYWRGRN